jgi:hypothetical protein
MTIFYHQLEPQPTYNTSGQSPGYACHPMDRVKVAHQADPGKSIAQEAASRDPDVHRPIAASFKLKRACSFKDSFHICFLSFSPGLHIADFSANRVVAFLFILNYAIRILYQSFSWDERHTADFHIGKMAYTKRWQQVPA